MATIFQFLGSLSDGGAETLVKDYALLLTEKGHNIIIITIFPPNKSTANYKILQDNGIVILSLYNNFSLYNRVMRIASTYRSDSFVLKKLIARYSPCAMHIHLGNLKSVKCIGKYIRQKGIKLFYTCHSLPDKFLGPNMKNENKAAKYLIAHAGLQMIALHDDMRKELNEMFDIQNTLVVNNGIDFEKYKPLSPEEDSKLRLEIGLPKDAFVLGHVGRFSKTKNHKFIVEIFKEVSKVRKNAWLLLIGSGSLQNEIEQQLTDNKLRDRTIILHSRSDVNQLLRLMDVFVFPSYFEGLGIALLEAQISGLRCVASDTINKAVFLTPSCIPISLSKPPKAWCEIILNPKLINNNHGDINAFNLRNEIQKIEKMYTNENIDSI